MIRGIANESAVFMALSARPFVKAIFEFGMVANADAPWLACSSDDIAIIDTRDLFPTANQTSVGENGIAIASVEINTSFASSSPDRALGNAAVDIIPFTVGDDLFLSYTSKGHIGRIIQQMVVLYLNHVVYVSAAEVGLLYVVVVYWPPSIMSYVRKH